MQISGNTAAARKLDCSRSLHHIAAIASRIGGSSFDQGLRHHSEFDSLDPATHVRAPEPGAGVGRRRNPLSSTLFRSQIEVRLRPWTAQPRCDRLAPPYNHREVVMRWRALTSSLCAVAIASSVGVSAQNTPLPPGRIAFISSTCSSGHPCLAIMDSDGTNVVELTSTEVDELAWSPDGTTIAYTNPDGLFRIPAEGGTPIHLVASAFASMPAWSPDGSRIAFNNYGIQVVPASGGPPVNLTDPTSRNPAWSSDGARIALLTNRDHFSDGTWAFELYTIKADGSGATRLAPGVAALGRPAWSPDNSRIVFTCTSGWYRNICGAQADGSGFEVLATDAALDNDNADAATPAWSPDQTRIAYGALDNSSDDCGYQHSMVNTMNPDGSGILSLGTGAGTSGTAVRAPVWSPDGSRIAFTNWDFTVWVFAPPCDGAACDAVVYIGCAASPSVYAMSADGSRKTQLATGYSPAWRP